MLITAQFLFCSEVQREPREISFLRNYHAKQKTTDFFLSILSALSKNIEKQTEILHYFQNADVFVEASERRFLLASDAVFEGAIFESFWPIEL